MQEESTWVCDDPVWDKAEERVMFNQESAEATIRLILCSCYVITDLTYNNDSSYQGRLSYNNITPLANVQGKQC